MAASLTADSEKRFLDRAVTQGQDRETIVEAAIEGTLTL